MKSEISLGLCGITALCTLGGFLVFPAGEFDNTLIYGLLLARVVSFLLIAVFYRLFANAVGKEPKNRIKRGGLLVLYLLITAFLVLSAVETIKTFCEFTSLKMGGVSLPAAVLILFFALFVITKNGETSFSKLSFLFGIVTVAAIIIIAVFSIGKGDVKYITPRGWPDIDGIVKNGIKLGIRHFVSPFIISISLIPRIKSTKSVLLGNGIGGFAAALVLLNIFYVLGADFSATLGYPYSSAVTVVGTGNSFSGMGGLFYLAVCFSNIVKCAAAVFGIGIMGKEVLKLQKI